MNDSNSSSISTRPTLRLKDAPRKSREDRKAAVPAPQSNPKLKPGAHWSDDYKSRMQADMDALTSR